ncbi:MAG TPA: ABC transporter substrate-binding protein [Candidatus Cybelea sp.]|nr:ABC transporter substrate-binding protein [Candidatus Cybelea sp.]
MWKASIAVSGIALLGTAFAANPAAAEKKYDPGASDTAIKIGQTMPYSGPASAYGTIGRVEAAYLKMVNEQGGINGRKVTIVSLDDAYSPPKAVEMTRQIVEQDEVLLDFNPLGTPTNTAIQKYLNSKKVPQLFVATGATKWGDPQHFPYTIGWQPNYQTEAVIYAKYILQNVKDAKIGVLYQNDDFGKDYVIGLKRGLGDQASKLIVKEVSYETTDPTIDSQIITLQGTGANVFFNVTIPKFAAQAIRKTYDIGWKPTHMMTNVSASVGSVLVPAGLEKAIGIISTRYLKDPTDPAFANDKGMIEWQAFMKKYYPEGDLKDASNVYGYTVAQGLVQVLKQCGDELTHDNVMKQASNLKDLELPLLSPGIKVNTSPTHWYPIDQEQLIKFDGKVWVPFGDVLSGS